MISELIININDTKRCAAIKYTHGVQAIEYSVDKKRLNVVLTRDYVCEDKSKLRDFNTSCEPFVHTFYDVEYIAIS